MPKERLGKTGMGRMFLSKAAEAGFKRGAPRASRARSARQMSKDVQNFIRETNMALRRGMRMSASGIARGSDGPETPAAREKRDRNKTASRVMRVDPGRLVSGNFLGAARPTGFKKKNLKKR